MKFPAHGRRPYARRYAHRKRNKVQSVLRAVREWVAGNRTLSIAIAGSAAVLVLAVLLIFIIPGPVEKMSGVVQSPDSGQLQEETGEPAGTDAPTEENLAVPAPESETSIGLLVGEGANAEKIASGFGKYAQSLVDGASGLDKYYNYTFGSDANQQIQDARNMINHNCKAIVVAYIDPAAMEVVRDLAGKSGIPLITIDAPPDSGYLVNILSDDADTAKNYADYIKENAVSGQLALVADKKGSAFSSSVDPVLKEAFRGSGIVYKTALYSAEAKYAENLDALLDSKPTAMVLKSDLAANVLKAAAAKDAVPAVVCADATAGFVKCWYAMRNGGLTVETETMQKNADGTETPVNSAKKVANSSAMLCAQLSADPADIGKAACRVAYNIALGRSLGASGPVAFSLHAGEMIHNDNLQEYYEKAKNMDDRAILYCELDINEIDGLFVQTASAE